jgi:acetyltransferase-like isoleucine patch superfamily enzyme
MARAMHPMFWVLMSPVFCHGGDSISSKFAEYHRPIDEITTMDNDVWIGQYVMKKQGDTIGDGVVVGIGSIVTKDVGPFEVWVGNPAKFLKKRFDDDTLEILRKSKWWLMSDDELLAYANDFNNI